jgi:flagellar biosynthesis protein FlhF
VALVGPTGVGKTTTIAKLAGQLCHAAGLRVALLTVDTYRIGAVAQIQTYAELLGVPLHVVRTPAEMRAAVSAERDADLLLVDTTGRSPRGTEGIASLRRILGEVPDLEVHLVVSATTKGTDLEEILRRFRPLRYRPLLATKLDEATSVGPLLGLALERDLAVSYLSTGQEVPDDLEPATPRHLAALLVPETTVPRPRGGPAHLR